MNQDIKNQLKEKTGNIRVKLADNSKELQGIIDDPSDLQNKLNTRIQLSNDLINSLNEMDAFIDAQPGDVPSKSSRVSAAKA